MKVSFSLLVISILSAQKGQAIGGFGGMSIHHNQYQAVQRRGGMSTC